MVVPVDLYGQCADLAAIAEACGRWGVPVLSDSAEALGALQHGRSAGRGARLAAFSFNGNKIVTGGGGGALASDDEALVARARHLATQAKEPAPHYQHETTGYSYGLSSLLAAVGRAQLRHLEVRVAQRRAVFARYAAGLSGLGDLLLTCTGPSSRNFALGHALGRGLSPAEALADSRGVAEGAATAPALLARAAAVGVEMPVSATVAAVLAGRLDVAQAVGRLMERPRRSE